MIIENMINFDLTLLLLNLKKLHMPIKRVLYSSIIVVAVIPHAKNNKDSYKLLKGKYP